MGRLHPDVEVDGVYVTLTNLTRMGMGPVTLCIPGGKPPILNIDYWDGPCMLLYPFPDTRTVYVYGLPEIDEEGNPYSKEELDAACEKYAYAVRIAIQEAGLWRRG